MKLASRKKRIFAATVDIIVVASVFIFTVIMFGVKSTDREGITHFTLNGFPGLLLTAGIACYFIIPEVLYGNTLGKYLFDIKVVTEKGGEIDFKQAFLRHCFDPIDFAPFAFIVFMIVTNNNEKKQRIGDQIAKTIVVEKTKRNYKKKN